MPIAPQITVTPEDITTKNFDITAVTRTTTTATYTAIGHTFSVGDIVLVSGIFPDEYNGTFTLTAVATNTFTVANSINLPITDPLGNAFWVDPSEYDYEDLSAVYGADSDDLAVIDGDIAGLDAMVAQKIQTYYQLTPPTGGTYTVGDLWFDTDDANKQYRWDGTNWISVQDGSIATKNRTYYSGTAPTGTFTVGDIWFDTNTGNKPYRWDGSSWISVQDASIATALSTANAAQTSANGKNKIIYSTSAASGTGTTVGDVWWQYNGSGQIIAQWEWSGSSWVSKTIGSAVIANIDAGKITAGTISVAISLEAATITGGSININNGTFVVTSAGAVSITAGAFNINSGTFAVSSLGSVTATSGTIGGWVLNPTALSSPGTNKIVLQSNVNAISFTSGSSQVAHIVPLGSGGLLMHYGASADPNGGAFPQMFVGSGNVSMSVRRASIGINTISVTEDWISLGAQYTYARERFYVEDPSVSTAAANGRIDSDGRVRRTSASSIRFKENIVNLETVNEMDPHKLLTLPVRAFTFKPDYLDTSDNRNGASVPGFIAEEVNEHYPAAADYDAEGNPENWNERFIIPGMLALIQDLYKEINQLKGK
jgi:hypothetical protein